MSVAVAMVGVHGCGRHGLARTVRSGDYAAAAVLCCGPLRKCAAGAATACYAKLARVRRGAGARRTCLRCGDGASWGGGLHVHGRGGASCFEPRELNRGGVACRPRCMWVGGWRGQRGGGVGESGHTGCLLSLSGSNGLDTEGWRGHWVRVHRWWLHCGGVGLASQRRLAGVAPALSRLRGKAGFWHSIAWRDRLLARRWKCRGKETMVLCRAPEIPVLGQHNTVERGLFCTFLALQLS